MNARDKIKLLETEKAGEIKIDKKCGKCKKSICCVFINQKIPAPKTKEGGRNLLWFWEQGFFDLWKRNK
jgi:hypothetical protein